MFDGAKVYVLRTWKKLIVNADTHLTRKTHIGKRFGRDWVVVVANATQTRNGFAVSLNLLCDFFPIFTYNLP